MIERKQYFGYRCKIADHEYDEYWCGVVCVPRWHPVRSVGYGDRLVLLFGGEWNVFINGDYPRLEMLDAVQLTAARLRSMQNGWDRLSPYEREYVVR